MGAGQADALKMVSVQVVVVGWRGAQGEGGSQGRVCTCGGDWGGGGGGGACKPAKIGAPVLKERMCAMLMDNNITGWLGGSGSGLNVFVQL